MTIIKKALDAYAKADEKKWGADRAQTVGASEVGSCARMIFWRKNAGDEHFGADEDEDYEDGWGAKTRGNVFEEWWAKAMKAHFDVRLMLEGQNQQTFRDGFLTATPDGYLTSLEVHDRRLLGIPQDYEGGVAIDCKSIDPRVVLHEPKPNHVFQLQVQMGTMQAAGLPAHYALISYTDASNWDQIKEYVVKFDPDVYAHAKKRAQMVMTAMGAEELAPDGIIAGGRECKFCPYTAACARLRNERVPEREYKETQLTKPDKDLLLNLAMNVGSMKREIEAGEKELAETTEELKRVLGMLNVRNFKEGNVSVSWSKVKGRRGWDNKAIREKLTELIDEQSMQAFEVQGEPTDRLVVTVKGS